MLFKIKICGITNVDDALAAVDAGADAIGLNFYRDSKRFIDAQSARQIVETVGDRARPVGVFVNKSADGIRQICTDVGLEYAQLHGDETPEFLKLLSPELTLIRARRIDERGLAAIVDDLKSCREFADGRLAAVLVDAAVPGTFGGSGQTVDWRQLANHREVLVGFPLILAGGLTPENVAEAIRIVRPDAVDVASGVESSPGKKDAIKVRDFVAAARAAFSN